MKKHLIASLDLAGIYFYKSSWQNQYQCTCTLHWYSLHKVHTVTQVYLDIVILFTCSKIWLNLSILATDIENSKRVKSIKGPYADHILILQGSTRSSTFFDIKWEPIFF